MSPKMYPYIVSYVKLLQEVEPDLVAPMLEVMNVVPSRGIPSNAALEATALAVSSSRVGVYETGSYVLGALADYDPRALQVIAALSCSRDAKIRHNAILCLTEETPSETTIQVIRSALSDKSSRVRQKAADWAGRLHLCQSLPDIRSALIRETHRETRDVMVWAVKTLQNPEESTGRSTAA